MDNYRFDIAGDVDIEAVLLHVAFRKHSKALGYAVTPGPALVLFWAEHEAATRFIAPLSAELVAHEVRAWLAAVPMPPAPDIDGSVKRGWRISNDAWGHVQPFGWPAFVRIEPQWALYGK